MSAPADPWFKQLAASEFANPAFYCLSAQERGLLHSMRLVYWIEDRLCSDPVVLARQVRLDPREVTDEVLGRVIGFFEQDPSNSGFLVEPWLKKQREEVREGRRRMAIAGKRGAQIANAARAKDREANRASDTKDGSVAGHPAGPIRGPHSPSHSHSPSQSLSTPSLGKRSFQLVDRASDNEQIGPDTEAADW